jgi:hypothetical protein
LAVYYILEGAVFPEDGGNEFLEFMIPTFQTTLYHISEDSHKFLLQILVKLPTFNLASRSLEAGVIGS